MNNKFSLSFGVSLVIVGFLNIFFETSNIILFGLTVSTTIFSIINIIVPKMDSNKSELLYIIPFVLLISLFCYSNSLMQYDIVKEIVNGKITNILTFISFGFLFISEYLNHKKNKLHQKEFEMLQVIQEFEYSSMILILINEYLGDLVKKGIIMDEESRNFLNRIDDLCTEKATLANIDLSLLKLNKDEYTIQDFNDSYKLHNDTINYEKNIEEHDKKKNVEKEQIN